MLLRLITSLSLWVQLEGIEQMYFPAGIVIALEIILLLMLLHNEHTYVH